jgi:hypothetical protein
MSKVCPPLGNPIYDLGSLVILSFGVNKKTVDILYEDKCGVLL